MESPQGSPRQNLLRNAAQLTQAQPHPGKQPSPGPPPRPPQMPSLILFCSQEKRPPGGIRTLWSYPQHPSPTSNQQWPTPSTAHSSQPWPRPDPVSSGQCLGRRPLPHGDSREGWGFPTGYWGNSQAPRELKPGEGLALSQQQPHQNEHRGPKCPMKSPEMEPSGPWGVKKTGAMHRQFYLVIMPLP